MERSRRIAAVLGLVCLGVFIASMVGLVRRIGEYNSQSGRTMYAFNPVGMREFQFAGRPVSLVDEDREGQYFVIVHYGEREQRLVAPQAVTPGSPQLPNLVRHADWLRVLRFAPFKGASGAEFRAHLDEGNDRLAIVTRRPATAADPHTGQVWNRDWLFEFLELMPDGTFRTETLRYPKTRGDKTPKPGELKAGTWQMDAAMGMMPGSPPDSLNFGRPSASFKDDALRNAGWTMPAAVVSALGLMACIAVMFGPRRVRA